MSFVGSFGNRSYLSSGIKKTEGWRLEGLEIKAERWGIFIMKLFKVLEQTDFENRWTFGVTIQKVINSLL